MPSFIATWVGLGVVVLVLDAFRKQEADRYLAPVRRMAGDSLRSALEGTVAFAMYYLVDSPPEEAVDAKQFLQGLQRRDLWLSFDAKRFESARADWRATLQQTDTRLARFLEGYWKYLLRGEPGQIEGLRAYASRAARVGVWELPDGPGARAQVWNTWRRALTDFCAAVDAYEELTGSPLAGTSADFAAFFRSRLEAQAP